MQLDYRAGSLRSDSQSDSLPADEAMPIRWRCVVVLRTQPRTQQLALLSIVDCISHCPTSLSMRVAAPAVRQLACSFLRQGPTLRAPPTATCACHPAHSRAACRAASRSCHRARLSTVVKAEAGAYQHVRDDPPASMHRAHDYGRELALGAPRLPQRHDAEGIV